MNTAAHMILGAAIFARPNKPKVNAAAIIGGLFPDLSLFFMVGWSLFIVQNDPGYVFGVQFFSPEWQQVFAVDNSFFLWGVVLALGVWLKRDWLKVFAGSALVHVLFDFLLHNDDARPHFWPVTDWLFISPVSYWDKDHYGAIVGPIEMGMVLILTVVLIRRLKLSWTSLIIGFISLFEFAPIFMIGGIH
tara:strand:- start:83 stop:652 length:570 start_codon:yes stop_codon:yes gene_type:complete